MMLGFKIEKAKQEYICHECKNTIKKNSKYFDLKESKTLVTLYKKYCNKCSKMLLRKLMIQLHEDKGD